MKMLKEYGIPVVHYWRPITKINSRPQDIEYVLSNVASLARCSVAVGLKASRALNSYYLNDGLISRGEMKEHGDYLPEGIMERVNSVLLKSGIKYPIYLHTSCAISSIIPNSSDYNGTFFRKDICSLYPSGASLCYEGQKRICEAQREQMNQDFSENDCRALIAQIMPGIRVAIDNMRIELLDPVYQEDLIHLIHRLKRPVLAKKVLYTNQYVGSVFS